MYHLRESAAYGAAAVTEGAADAAEHVQHGLQDARDAAAHAARTGAHMVPMLCYHRPHVL